MRCLCRTDIVSVKFPQFLRSISLSLSLNRNNTKCSLSSSRSAFQRDTTDRDVFLAGILREWIKTRIKTRQRAKPQVLQRSRKSRANISPFKRIPRRVSLFPRALRCCSAAARIIPRFLSSSPFHPLERVLVRDTIRDTHPGGECLHSVLESL